jgi:hypothetical protein
MPKGKRVPVTMRALIQRVNRKLAKEKRMLRAIHGTGAVGIRRLGKFCMIGSPPGGGPALILRAGVDPVKLAREIGVLQEWEEVVE